MKRMTNEHEKMVLEFEEKGCSDDDLVDFCNENKIDLKLAYKVIAIKYAPAECKGCKHIVMYGTHANLFPCNMCSRACKDRYEKE